MTRGTRYMWQDGKVDNLDESTAQAVGEELAAIEAKHGALDPERVINAARKNTSVLHRFFEWDDTQAAHKFRMEQARHLIRKVHVKVIGGNQLQKPLRAFVNVTSGDGESRYENIVSAMSDATKRQQILQRAHSELMGWRKRYSDLEEFSVVFVAIDQATERVAA